MKTGRTARTWRPEKALEQCFLLPALFKVALYFILACGLEIDLVAEESGRLSLFEIKLSKTPKPAMARHLLTFLDQGPDRPVNKAGVISLAEPGILVGKGIKTESLLELLEASPS